MRIDYIAQHGEKKPAVKVRKQAHSVFFPTEAIAVDVSFADRPGWQPINAENWGRDQ